MEKKLSFLDVELTHNSDGSTNWYMKKTYSGRLLNYYSDHPKHQNSADVKI